MLVEYCSGERVLLQPGHREHLAEVNLLVVRENMGRDVAVLQLFSSAVGQLEPVCTSAGQHDVQHRNHDVESRNSNFHILTLFYNPNQPSFYSIISFPPTFPKNLSDPALLRLN